MYTLLIADDERIERDALRFIITRATTTVDRIVEAANGTEAIAIAEREQPDIVFLDIKMPGTNGIDAARAIKTRLPHARIVFLTAFDYFDYAHEAIRIGVSDFIVKPATDERVMEVIVRVSAELDALRAREEQHPTDERRRLQMVELLERELISDLIRGELDREQLDSYLSVFGIPALSGYPVCISLDYDSYPMAVESDEQRSVLLRRTLGAFRSILREAGIPVFGSDQHHTLQLLLCCAASERTTLQQRLETAAEAVWRSLSIRIRIGVGPHATEAPPFAHGFALASHTVRSGDTTHVVVWHDGRGEMEPDQHEPLKYDHEGRDGGGGTQVRAGGSGAPGDSDRTGDVDHTGAPYQTGNPHLRGDSHRGADLRHGSDLAHSAVAQVQHHIRAHFNDELSLEQAARMVRLSPFYFSKIFKQHAGTNFVDYVNRIRIDRACELLREGRLSIKEIADHVGYSDANYFARMFKRRMGETPSRYRGRVQR